MKQSILERTRHVPNEPYLVDEARLAQWLGVSESTLLRWRRKLIAQGDPLPVIRLDGGTWFSLEAVEAFIQERFIPDTLGCQRTA